jgi:hypothetical protein
VISACCTAVSEPSVAWSWTIEAGRRLEESQLSNCPWFLPSFEVYTTVHLAKSSEILLQRQGEAALPVRIARFCVWMIEAL